MCSSVPDISWSKFLFWFLRCSIFCVSQNCAPQPSKPVPVLEYCLLKGSRPCRERLVHATLRLWAVMSNMQLCLTAQGPARGKGGREQPGWVAFGVGSLKFRRHICALGFDLARARWAESAGLPGKWTAQISDLLRANFQTLARAPEASMAGWIHILPGRLSRGKGGMHAQGQVQRLQDEHVKCTV